MLIPNCDNCIYEEECVWVSHMTDPYTCGVFGEWEVCTKCGGCGYLVSKNKVTNCNCSNGYVRRG